MYYGNMQNGINQNSYASGLNYTANSYNNCNKKQPRQKTRVERILAGLSKIKNTDSYTCYSVDELTQLQAAFNKRTFLTAPETGIWLNKSMSTIYRLIAAGKIAVMRGEENSDYLVDVEQTRKLLGGK